MTTKSYDRSSEDVGNIVSLEHVNVTVPDQEMALVFYVTGLGLTRDPYMLVGRENMWVNVGQQQFHLPTRGSQVLRGHVGVVVPSLDALEARLKAVKPSLSGTAFGFAREQGYLAVTCPWGNRLRCIQAQGDGDGVTLGIRYVELSVREGVASRIGAFYQEVMGAPFMMMEDAEGVAARISVGLGQALVFRETAGELPAYDGHHIAIYIANFSSPYALLQRRGLISEESGPHQYRFVEIVDPATGDTLFELEHEVRSLHHPMYGRDLVNRNPDQSLRAYVRGRDRLEV